MEHLYKFEVKHGRLVGSPILTDPRQQNWSKLPYTNDRMKLEHIVFSIYPTRHFNEEMIITEANRQFDNGEW